MNDPLPGVQFVTEAKEGLKQSIRAKRLGWLLQTDACRRCVGYLARQQGWSGISAERVLLAAGSLLFILAAMHGVTENDRDEALCLMGTRGVDAYCAPFGKRLKMAALARRKPLKDPRWYQRSGQLADTQQQLAARLHALMTCPTLLDEALVTYGDEAVSRYL